MDSIQVDSGVKRICINGDPARVITFNPGDVLFAERFYKIYDEFRAKMGEIKSRAAILDQTARDENNAPADFAEGLAFIRESCEWMHDRIDALFGSGTSQAAFDGALSFEMIAQFLEGITPYIQVARAEKLDKYADKKPHSKAMK